jgi:hypothetical protein
MIHSIMRDHNGVTAARSLVVINIVAELLARAFALSAFVLAQLQHGADERERGGLAESCVAGFAAASAVPVAWVQSASVTFR